MMKPGQCGAAILCVFLAGWPPLLAQAPKKEVPPPAKEVAADLTPAELMKAGRAAFEAQDFAKAEQHFDQLLADSYLGRWRSADRRLKL